MSYFVNLFIYLNVYAVLALSLNLVTGYTGLVNLAHAAFFGVGAYVASMAMIHFGWGFLPATGIAIAAAAILSLAISLPSLRFASSYFVISSLAVQTLTFSILYNWTDVTHGPYGLSEIPRPRFFGWEASSLGGMALVSAIAAVVCGLILYGVLRSPWGRLLEAIRDDELAARGLGKRARVAKIQANAIACGMAAVAGSLYASYVGFIDPTTFTLEESILLLSMVLIGGTGNVRGPIVGAAVMLGIRESLRFLDIPDPMAPHLRAMAYGLLLVVIAHKRPQGIAGKYRFR
ncbi:MAG: branched-chain amino acid ABC transporter permease [Myxococcota bacterium]